jgi:pseudouridylate synthase
MGTPPHRNPSAHATNTRRNQRGRAEAMRAHGFRFHRRSTMIRIQGAIMDRRWNQLLRIGEQALISLEESRPVVALESSVLAHGLPQPLNLDVANACEAVVRAEGAVPATIGVVDGQPAVGLNGVELGAFASGCAPNGRPIVKVSLSNLAGALLRHCWGATTVSATLQIAHLAGLRVLATGGIGGVHRGAAESFDISADLAALARYPLICVCAGAKAILDLPKTVEALETLGIPIIGLGTDEFPAFYSRESGLAVDLALEDPNEIAELARQHWRAGSRTAVLVCAPPPEEFALDRAEVERVTEEAVGIAARRGMHGRAVTPFLLDELTRLTAGATLNANRALLINNARVGARIALSIKQ